MFFSLHSFTKIYIYKVLTLHVPLYQKKTRTSKHNHHFNILIILQIHFFLIILQIHMALRFDFLFSSYMAPCNVSSMEFSQKGNDR